MSKNSDNLEGLIEEDINVIEENNGPITSILDEISDAELVSENEEEVELTDEEKRDILIRELKNSKVRFRPIKHRGNVTINQFDNTFKKKRNKKIKATKASRRANRR